VAQPRETIAVIYRRREDEDARQNVVVARTGKDQTRMCSGGTELMATTSYGRYTPHKNQFI
jgi:hypothetical protein